MRPQLVVKLGSHVSHYCENIYNFKRIIKKCLHLMHFCFKKLLVEQLIFHQVEFISEITEECLC